MRDSLPRLVFALVFGLIAGITIGRISQSAPPPSSNPLPVSADEQSCTRYKELYDRLRVDFITLQDQKSSSGSVAVCPQSTASSNGVVSTEEKPGESTEVAAQTPTSQDFETNSEPEDDETTVETMQSDLPPPGSEAMAVLDSASATEKNMQKADTPSKKSKFLDRVKLKTPMQTTDAMKSVTEKDKFFENLFGVFKAPIQFTDKKRKNGRIVLLVKKPENPEDKKAWVVRIDVDNGKGKVSRQNGGIEMLRTASDKSASYFLRSSETSYLQMFYRSSSDQFLGNYYEKNKAGAYPRRGTFWLKRQNP